MNGTAVCATLFGIATILVSNPRPSEAWVYASDLYPYCQLDSSSGGGMSCYLSSMNQCEFAKYAFPIPDIWARLAHANGSAKTHHNGAGGDVP